MGAGGIYPNYPSSNGYTGYHRPYYNHGRYPSPGHIPSYGYPPNNGMSYGRGFHRPYASMNYGPMINSFPPSVYHQQISNGGVLNPHHAAFGGLQSAPPSATPDGNIHFHRPREHRPHFDDQ
ncbi:hypothetical protein I4U23_000663 [Adineta vaga]|nr:hypothetical protein I4U23_000663 [Adineta vaga]